MENKTNKQLIQVAINNIALFTIDQCPGLCSYAYYLYSCKIIDSEECRRLKYIINSYIKEPKWINQFIKGEPNVKQYTHRGRDYFWKEYDVKPRIKYLNWLLQQL